MFSYVLSAISIAKSYANLTPPVPPEKSTRERVADAIKENHQEWPKRVHEMIEENKHRKS